MRLAEFIRNHLDDIIVEWEAFAKTLLPAAEDMSQAELRDHSRQILMAVADDLDTAQTPTEQQFKSRGLAAVIDRRKRCLYSRYASPSQRFHVITAYSRVPCDKGNGAAAMAA